MMIDRRLIQEIDWILLGLILLQSLVGVVFIYSSSHVLPGAYHVRQLIWIGLSLLVLSWSWSSTTSSSSRSRSIFTA